MYVVLGKNTWTWLTCHGKQNLVSITVYVHTYINVPIGVLFGATVLVVCVWVDDVTVLVDTAAVGNGNTVGIR